MPPPRHDGDAAVGLARDRPDGTVVVKRDAHGEPGEVRMRDAPSISIAPLSCSQGAGGPRRRTSTFLHPGWAMVITTTGRS